MIKLIISGALLAVAEVLASLSVWSGTPTDWRGAPLNFWTFEIWRLQYWAIFVLLCSLLWFITWYSLPQGSHIIKMTVFGAALAVASETLTSFAYWSRLSWTQASHLGWSYFPTYFWGHLISWAVVVVACLCVWSIWNRNRARRSHSQIT
jgi:hypothetical protein